jgi:hypothetical protein
VTFQAGKPRHANAGRKKGTPNKTTQTIQEKLDALGCDPLEGMAQIALEAKATGDMVLAGRMYAELAQYVAPKRKAVEQTGPNGGAIQHQINPVTVTAEEARAINQALENEY